MHRKCAHISKLCNVKKVLLDCWSRKTKAFGRRSSVPFVKTVIFIVVVYDMLLSFFLIFLEITLMESDTLSDDLIETKTYDLTKLELNKVYQKTFVFRQVQCESFLYMFCNTKRVTQSSVTGSR